MSDRESDAEFIARARVACEESDKAVAQGEWMLGSGGPVRKFAIEARNLLPEALDRLKQATEALRVRHSDDANDMALLAIDRDSWKARAEQAEAAVEKARELCAQDLMRSRDTHMDLRRKLQEQGQHAMAEMQKIRAETCEEQAAAIRSRKP